MKTRINGIGVPNHENSPNMQVIKKIKIGE